MPFAVADPTLLCAAHMSDGPACRACTHSLLTAIATYSQHCFDCSRCVNKLDHHCWWLGNCVGKQNHRGFVVYLLFQVMLICALGITASVGPQEPPVPALAGMATVCCIILALLLGLLAGTLFCFQSGLIWRGETTWEHLRREKLNSVAGLPPKARPYDRGPCQNCQNFWFGQPQPAQIRPQAEASSQAWKQGWK